MGNMRSNALPSLTHLVPTSSEKPPSVRDSSEAFDTESLCSDATLEVSLSSDATLEVSLCSDDEVDLQRNIQQIMHQHTDDVIKKWGNSEQWVLELRDGKRVAVPIHFSSPPGDDIVGVDESNHLAIVPGRATKSKELNSEAEKGIDVFMED